MVRAGSALFLVRPNLLNVRDIWRQIDSQIETRTPQFAHLLNPPASGTQVSQLEAHIGMTFPPSVRESYLVHNGESEETDGLLDLWKFLPLDGVKEWWEEMKLIEESYEFGEFDCESMIPIMFREGDLRYVDRSTNGEETPLVEWNHENPTRDEFAPDFGHFLSSFLKDFEDGNLIAEPEFGLKAIIQQTTSQS